MRTAHRRETIIALKAAHTAIRVARDVGYPQIDVAHIECDDCHAELDWQHLTDGATYLLTCPSCGKYSELPLHLRQFLRPTPLEIPPSTHDTWPTRAASSPRSLVISLLFCCISMLVLAWVIFIKLR